MAITATHAPAIPASTGIFEVGLVLLSSFIGTYFLYLDCLCQWRRENGPLGRSKSVPPGAVGQHKCPHQLFREMSYRRAGQQKVGGKVLVRPILGQARLEVGMQRSAGSA